VQFRELKFPGSLEITPVAHGDDRGVFLEWVRVDKLAELIGHDFTLAQANMSVSARGVVRGIHYADVPPGQAKYVTCVRGAVLDYIVDVRVGSPTFGQWDSVRLDDVDRRAVYIPEGFGHAFVALTDLATVTYLVSSVYNPVVEHGINPLDDQIALVFPDEAGEALLSPKDVEAPSLAQAKAAGLLPLFDDLVRFHAAQATR
jgi:dTDP-4-dehydrorhamnose 3,5-epimerase